MTFSSSVRLWQRTILPSLLLFHDYIIIVAFCLLLETIHNNCLYREPSWDSVDACLSTCAFSVIVSNCVVLYLCAHQVIGKLFHLTVGKVTKCFDWSLETVVSKCVAVVQFKIGICSYVLCKWMNDAQHFVSVLILCSIAPFRSWTHCRSAQWQTCSLGDMRTLIQFSCILQPSSKYRICTIAH